ncbi:CCR4-NOT transcription complex subunit 2 [Perkinsus olseni]|uniref:CCR4-NOT transcription complex subunit 2 n=1 Tax=Perkinsus olseni TaxID=32597 RepID=A0A7J6QC13_PEROL|nr:CCR4-NOT transcription complex subunit 2 [Perkinsus olseni]
MATSRSAYQQQQPVSRPPPPPGMTGSPQQAPAGYAGLNRLMSNSSSGDSAVQQLLMNASQFSAAAAAGVAKPPPSSGQQQLPTGVNNGSSSGRAPAPPLPPQNVIPPHKAEDLGRYGLDGMLVTVSPSDTADQFRRQLQLGLDAGSLLGVPEAPFDTPGTGLLSKDKLRRYRVPNSYFVGGGDQNDQNMSGFRFAVKASHPKQYQTETLFYIFHALAGDEMQAVAAMELHSRGWRYQRKLQLWFRVATQEDLDAAKANGDGPSRSVKQDGSQHYVYFDPSAWKNRIWSGSSAAIDTNEFLTAVDHQHQLMAAPVTFPLQTNFDLYMPETTAAKQQQRVMQAAAAAAAATQQERGRQA